MSSPRHSIQSEANSNPTSTFIEEAINFFSSGKCLTLRKQMVKVKSLFKLSGDSQELSKQNWKPYLDALEEYYERNQDDDSEKFGLSEDQMNKVSQIFKKGFKRFVIC